MTWEGKMSVARCHVKSPVTGRFRVGKIIMGDFAPPVAVKIK